MRRHGGARRLLLLSLLSWSSSFLLFFLMLASRQRIALAKYNYELSVERRLENDGKDGKDNKLEHANKR